jgi:hypothetical protein
VDTPSVTCADIADEVCTEPAPGGPGIAVDPICIDDGMGAECVDDGSNPPSGVNTVYDLTIAFNESVTDAGLEEVARIVDGIAPGTDFLIRESFPPVGAGRIVTAMLEFCPDIEAKFESLPYVSDATCAVAADDPPLAEPDEPVSSEPGGAPDSGPTTE